MLFGVSRGHQKYAKHNIDMGYDSWGYCSLCFSLFIFFFLKSLYNAALELQF